jgi:hypothetical protein
MAPSPSVPGRPPSRTATARPAGAPLAAIPGPSGSDRCWSIAVDPTGPRRPAPPGDRNRDAARFDGPARSRSPVSPGPRAGAAGPARFERRRPDRGRSRRGTAAGTRPFARSAMTERTSRLGQGLGGSWSRAEGTETGTWWPRGGRFGFHAAAPRSIRNECDPRPVNADPRAAGPAGDARTRPGRVRRAGAGADRVGRLPVAIT